MSVTIWHAAHARLLRRLGDFGRGDPRSSGGGVVFVVVGFFLLLLLFLFVLLNSKVEPGVKFRSLGGEWTQCGGAVISLRFLVGGAVESINLERSARQRRDKDRKTRLLLFFLVEGFQSHKVRA